MKEYPCCGYRYRSAQVPNLSIYLSEACKTDNLCSDCARFDLLPFLTGFLTVTKPHMDLTIKKSSQCDMCNFFLAALADGPPVHDGQDIIVSVQCYIPSYYPKQSIPMVSILSSDQQDEQTRLILPIGIQDTESLTPLTARPVRRMYVDFDLLITWIQYCTKHHGKCCSVPLENGKGRHLRTKVIDCVTREVVAAPEGCIYVALSYVWGACNPGDLVQRCSEGTSANFLPDEVPQTVEDAIVATLRLRYRYLWVDQYCIDQCDPSELHSQLGSMDMIYNLAAVTIVAAAGNDAAFGLPGVSRPRTAQPIISRNGKTWTSCRKDPRPLLTRSKWVTRAWTYQEQVFSRRRLIFTEEQIVFECNTSDYFCESLELDPHRHASSGSPSSLTLFAGGGICINHITVYAKRQLTYQSDVLNGLRGIFEYLRSRDGYAEHWGIPLGRDEGFARALLWEHDSNETPSRRHEFPSWSWAGWVTPVRWNKHVRAIFAKPEEPKENAFPYATEHPKWGEPSSPLRMEESTTVSKRRRPPKAIKHEFSVQVLDGTYIPLDEAMSMKARQTSVGPDLVLFTMNLAVTADVLMVRLSQRKVNVQAPSDVEARSQPHYAVTASLKSPLVRNLDIFWPFDVTPTISQYPQLHSTLLTTTFEVILLRSSFGLVIWRTGAVCKRLGILPLKAQIEEDSLVAILEAVKGNQSVLQTVIDGLWGLKLQDHYPVGRRTVVIS